MRWIDIIAICVTIQTLMVFRFSMVQIGSLLHKWNHINFPYGIQLHTPQVARRRHFNNDDLKSGPRVHNIRKEAA